MSRRRKSVPASVTLNAVLLIACLGTCTIGRSQQQEPAAGLPAPVPLPSHAEVQSTTIRLMREREKAVRQSIDPGTLKAICRYESSISTPPPPNRVALTFDDGPDAIETEYILGVLAKHHVRATFFLIGEKAEARPDLVKQITEGGHLLVGNHSWSHPNFHDLSVEMQAAEVRRTEALLDQALTPKLFRYPFGNASCETNDLLHASGYRIVGWHVDSCDWAFNRTGTVDEKEAESCEVAVEDRGDFVHHVLASARLHKGGIVLMHEIQHNTIARLDEVIQRLLEDGFDFGALDDADFQSSLR